MPKYTLIHVGKPGSGPAPVRKEVVEAPSAQLAMAKYSGRRLTAEEAAKAVRS